MQPHLLLSTGLRAFRCHGLHSSLLILLLLTFNAGSSETNYAEAYMLNAYKFTVFLSKLEYIFLNSHLIVAMSRLLFISGKCFHPSYELHVYCTFCNKIIPCNCYSIFHCIGIQRTAFDTARAMALQCGLLFLI